MNSQWEMRTLHFKDTYFSRDERYSLGIEEQSGRYFASFPVSNGIVDYEEFYVLTAEQYERFLTNAVDALAFVDQCRRREHDDLLMQKPGWNRGTPV